MLWGDGNEGDAHDGVGAGGEDVHLAVLQQLTCGILDGVRKGETDALGLADPVFLHQLDALGPTVQTGFHVLQQLGGVLGDVQVIARNLALFNHRTGAPAFAINHLLIGQNRHINRVPVHHLGFAVGDALLQHFEEQPLVPLVILGRAGGHFAAPVDGQAHRLHLLFHVGDVVKGPLCGRHAVFHGGVFSGQAKGVPAHGHEHVVALHAQLAGQHVVDGVVAHVAHVQLAAGVGQHGASIILWFRLALCVHRTLGHAVGISRCPMAVRGFFNRQMVVGRCVSSSGSRGR